MRRQVPVRRVPVLLALVAALLGLSGCFRASEDVHVKADGSGTVALRAEVDKKALAALFSRFGGAGGVAPLTPMRPVDRSFPDGTKVRVVDRPDRATLDASFDFRDPDDYARKLQQVAQAVSGPGTTATDPGAIEIRRTGNRMEVALDVGSSAGSADDLDLSLLRSVLGPDSLPKLVVTITMPGSILATNGTTQGRTATWDLSKDAPAVLTASSTVAEPGLPLWPPLLGGGLILLVLGVTITFFLSQRRHASRVAADEAGPESWPSADQPGIGTFFPPASQAPPQGWPVPSPVKPPPPPPPPPAWQAATWLLPPATEPLASPPPPSLGVSPLPPPGLPPWIAAPIGPSPDEPPAPVAVAGPTRPAAVAPDPGDPLPWRVPGPPSHEPPADRPPSPPDPPAPTPSLASSPSSAPTPGWYPDPAGGEGLRYWDGRQWTPHTT